MARRTRESIHEVDFYARVAADAEQLFASDRVFFPFVEVRVEGFGTVTSRRNRKELRFYEMNSKLALLGEVKPPGADEGRSPFEGELAGGTRGDLRHRNHMSVQSLFGL